MNAMDATLDKPATSSAFATGGPQQKISVKDLKFFYGPTIALKGIDLPLYKNRVTAFIGPSGCGKSTLLRVFNRMYDLDPNQRAEGEVLLDGQNLLDPKQDLNLLRSRVDNDWQNLIASRLLT